MTGAVNWSALTAAPSVVRPPIPSLPVAIPANAKQARSNSDVGHGEGVVLWRAVVQFE